MKECAKALAEQWLSKLDDASEWMVTAVEEMDGVTVAFYARKDGALVAGNAPLIIECESGNVICTGTAMPVEYYIRNYRAIGNPHVEPVECVRLNGSTAALSSVSAARALCGFANKGILEAMGIAERVKTGEPVLVIPKEGITCDRLLEVVRSQGFEADIVFQDPRKWESSPSTPPTGTIKC